MNVHRFLNIILKNRYVNRDSAKLVRASRNKVNLNAWFSEEREHQNIGDWLSKIVVDEMLERENINPEKKVSRTKHLHAVGSILPDYKDMTVWGSGFLSDPSTKLSPALFSLFRSFYKLHHKTDVRAVRGPETAKILNKMGISCPEVYGDPAVLMPMFYTPVVEEKKEFSIVPHFSMYDEYRKHFDSSVVISTFTNDYKRFIDRIASANVVISSSLHGVILAEAYGIPAVYMAPSGIAELKFKDYYYSTGRFDFPVAKNVEEALKLAPPPLPDFTEMRESLVSSFPYDLWE